MITNKNVIECIKCVIDYRNDIEQIETILLLIKRTSIIDMINHVEHNTTKSQSIIDLFESMQHYLTDDLNDLTNDLNDDT